MPNWDEKKFTKDIHKNNGKVRVIKNPSKGRVNVITVLKYVFVRIGNPKSPEMLKVALEC